MEVHFADTDGVISCFSQKLHQNWARLGNPLRVIIIGAVVVRVVPRYPGVSRRNTNRGVAVVAILPSAGPVRKDRRRPILPERTDKN